MRIVIAGGHGRIARRLEALLVARGDSAVGIVRNPAHAADLAALGAEPVVLDLESTAVDDLAAVVRGADTVVFAAGAGPGSGAPRKITVDRDAAALLADAAEAAGVPRYLMVSAMNVEQADPASDDVFQVYLRAKAEADADLRTRALTWTIVRPGRLTDAPGTGRVAVAPSLPRGDVPRDDVAAVLAGALARSDGALDGVQFDLVGGEMPVADALATLSR
jgi:uncharacterized protein YbjT (DUF2867 family)